MTGSRGKKLPQNWGPRRKSRAVVPCGGAALLEGSSLLVSAQRSRFSYLFWEPLSSGQLLCALTAEHKAILWKDFLADGIQAADFDWLWAQYYTGEPLFLLEWELSLHLALEELGVRVERGMWAFRVLDEVGWERQSDFARGGRAAEVFLKLLFPIDTR